MRIVKLLMVGLAVTGLPLAAQQRRGGQSTQSKTQSRTPSQTQKTAPSQAQRGRGSAPGVGGGYIPSPPPKRRPGAPAQRTGRPDMPGHPAAPHVHERGNIWVGRATPNDPRYRLRHPWPHGHFPGPLGRDWIWRLGGGGPSRFWFGGFVFIVAPVDVGFCNDWLWNNDDIVLYNDPDQIGWYIAYNTRLGTWCHVEYMGPM